MVEQELIKRLVRGDQEAYAEIIEMIEKPLINYGSSQKFVKHL